MPMVDAMVQLEQALKPLAQSLPGASVFYQHFNETAHVHRYFSFFRIFNAF
jgi:hypothetical protein